MGGSCRFGLENWEISGSDLLAWKNTVTLFARAIPFRPRHTCGNSIRIGLVLETANMAKKNRDDRKDPQKPNPNDPQSKADLPEFLRTDDWLQITPPPIRKELPEPPQSRGPAADDQATDMIELEDENAGNELVPQSTMLFSDPDDSVLLADDLPSVGPLSGKLKGGESSIKLPIGKSQKPGDEVVMGQDDVDIGSEPEVDLKALAGPSTSSVRRSLIQSSGNTGTNTGEDAIGGPLEPTGPGSGWLQSPAKPAEAPATDPKSRMPSVPSVSNMQSTWAELDLPASKLQPPAAKPETKPAPAHPDSWHPSSGNIGVPSLANIDLPPDEAAGSDVFSKASRPGAGPAAIRIEIPKPKPVVKEEPKPVPPPASEAPAAPQAAPVQPKGSWHPSSSDIRLPSVGEIDLPPPSDGSDVFTGANRPGRGVQARVEPPSTSAKPVAPVKVEPPKAERPPVETPKPPKPVAPSLSVTNFDVVPPSAPLAPAPKSGPVGLEPTSDFTSSSADIELPPEKDTGASDIFSTAKPVQAEVSANSGLFSGAVAPESGIERATAGESNIFADRSAAPPADAGRVDLAPPGLEVTGEINLSKFSPGSPSGAINFALPSAASDARSSSIEVVDTSESLDGGKSVRPSVPKLPFEGPRSENLHSDEADDLDGAALEAELARQLEEDEGRPDFNILPGVSPSDSNILGDRSLSERTLSGPQSSSVNLADPDALSNDPAVDSGQPSSIFSKSDQASQATGHVDLDEIPLMGSSDSASMPQPAGNSAVLGGRLDEPLGADLEESVFDVKMPKDEAADSGMIDWSIDAAKVTDRLGMQASMEESRRTELTTASDQASLPTVPRKAAVPRPTSRPDFDLDAEPATRPGKPRNAILMTALSLLAGAGIGAGAMFLAGGGGGGTGTGTGDGKATAELKAQINEIQSKLTVSEQTALVAKDEANNQRAAAEAAAKALAEEKMRLEANLATEKAKVTTAETAARKLMEDKTALLTEVKKATDDAAKRMTEAANAKREAEDKGKLLDAAKVAADAATAKLKAADAALDPLLEKFKTAKLIDDKADREKALAALPDAIKKANLITGEGEIAKLAKELTDARNLLKTQKDDADRKLAVAMSDLTAAKKDAEKQLADAKTANQKAMADLQAKVDGADKRIVDEVKKAVAAATKDADAKLAMAQATLVEQKKAVDLELQKEKTARANESKQFEARLAQQVAQFEKDLASARAGVVVPLSDAATAKAERSSSAYDAGTTAYFAGRHAEAEKAFAEATKADPADARFWYFLGLSKYAQGKTADAAADFKTGAEWESRAKPGRRAVAAALERIQGPARLALEAARP
jgi:hypothetical protein